MAATQQRIASGSTRGAVAVLIAWALVAGALAWFGLGLGDRLAPSTLHVPGTESARGAALIEEHFGASEPVAILLTGPRGAVDRQGRRLVERLERHRDARVLAPWDGRDRFDGLRPDPRTALVLADLPMPDGDLEELAVRAKAVVADTITEPVEGQVTGFAVVAEQLKRTSLEATERAELIALPILLIVLLLVFRSPLAAAIPLLLGAATVAASRGLTAILAEWIAIDGTAIAVASMVGLALGVDYSLLLVSRFREELAAGAPVGGAVTTSLATAGRTIAHAGVVLACALLAPLLLAPGSLLTSLAIVVMVVVAVSVVNALVAGRALLLVLGHRIDLFAFGRADRGARLGGLLAGVLRRPLAPAALVLALMLVLAMPVTAFNTGPVSAQQLPPGDHARQAAEAIEEVMGPGWSAPFAVVVARERGPITDLGTMEVLASWQRDVAERPEVEAILGPNEVLAAASDRIAAASAFGGDPSGSGAAGDEDPFGPGGALGPDGVFGPDGAPPGLTRAVESLGGVGRNLAAATDAVGELRRGLEQAAAGGRALGAGGQAAATGAAQLDDALAAAAAGARTGSAALAELDDDIAQAIEGTSAAHTGARQLERGLRRVSDGTLRLIDGVLELRSGIRFNAQRLEITEPHLERGEEALDEAFRELEEMTIGRTDPRYPDLFEALREAVAEVTGWDPVSDRPVDPFYGGAASEVGRAATNERRAAGALRDVVRALRQLRQGVNQLNRGAARLANGLGRLERGAASTLDEGEALIAQAGTLARGLDQLGAGASALRGGLDRLAEGGALLGTELGEGASRAGELERGLRAAIRRFRGPDADGLLGGLGSDLTPTPSLLGSGYSFLAGLAAASPEERRAAGGAIALDRGGRAARMIVIPAAAPATDEVADAIAGIADSADELGRRIGAETALTGGAAELADYDRATSERLPLIILAAAAIAFLVLVVILRALLLPLIAVLLNLLTVAAAFGVLAVLFQLLPGEPLGGPGYTDAVAAVAVFGLVFGLSIDYEVFLLGRMREGWIASGDPATAIRYGLDRTAVVITGAAAIMVGVFCVFATVEVTTIRQFGIGLAVAITLDATLVRLILLPALMRIAGPWAWWFPAAPVPPKRL